MIYIITPYPNVDELRQAARKYDSLIIHLTQPEAEAIENAPGKYDELMHVALSQVLGKLRGLPERFPVAMYELERDKHDGAIVLRRGIFERYDNRVGWYVTIDAQAGLPIMFPKTPDKHGLFFRHVLSRQDDFQTYLWDTPEEAFAWWETNRKKIVAFSSDRLRLLPLIREAKGEEDADQSHA